MRLMYLIYSKQKKKQTNKKQTKNKRVFSVNTLSHSLYVRFRFIPVILK